MNTKTTKLRASLWIAIAWTLLVVVLLAAVPVGAQDGDTPANTSRVQSLTGSAASGAYIMYELNGLKAGEELSVYVTRTAGNLDPLAALTSAPLDSETLEVEFYDRLAAVTDTGGDPLTAEAEIFGGLFEIWDDDSGQGYDSSFLYEIPADGTYYLLIVRNPFSATSGDYHLTVGLDAPQVLKGDAQPAGEPFASLFQEGSRFEESVQVVTDAIEAKDPLVRFDLRRLRKGDTLYAYATATSGNLAPQLVLEDFGGKPLRSANLSGAESVASLKFTLDEDARSFQLMLSGASIGATRVTEGDYRLVLGVNAPEVLEGKAEPRGRAVLQETKLVGIGVKLQQITGVDQISEKFGGVAELKLEWYDPALAFSPDTCNCDFMVFTGEEFTKYTADRGIQWPQFTVFNQQGNRWIQNKNAILQPDGSAVYQERFTTDFQAPLFDFTKFPFDTQQLYIQVDSLYPTEFFTYTDRSDLSEIGGLLGEEEWFVIDSSTSVETVDGSPSYRLNFTTSRHLNFYIFRILVPIILIIVVSWFTFFLKDFGKRVDVASANLLVFVAFNFTVSGELPRLGYLTFMDAVLIGTFIISALVVVLNVALRRLEAAGREELAAKIDRPLIWIYPVLYIAGGLVAYWLFLA